MEFRYVFHTDRYDETVAFFAERLGFELSDQWDYAPERRGSVFASGSGFIEVMSRDPAQQQPGAGGRVLIEVEDVDRFHRRLLESGASELAPPVDRHWGHRVLSVLDPNGLEIALFTKISA
jgi:catechol 2,3-dioxygenase-like lactoylglutathione lyase family enzyme